jgi:hypothetical protein
LINVKAKSSFLHCDLFGGKDGTRMVGRILSTSAGFGVMIWGSEIYSRAQHISIKKLREAAVIFHKAGAA